MSLLRAGVFALLGAVTGLGALLAHAGGWIGLTLALAASLAVAVAVPRRWWGRTPFAAGWVLVVGRGAWPRPEGDYLVAADGPGYALLVTGLVLVVLALVTLPAPRREAADLEDAPPGL